MRFKSFLSAWLLSCFCGASLPLGAVTQGAAIETARQERAYRAGLSAYFFFYPLIIMELTRQQSIATRVGMNQFAHSAGFPPVSDKLVVRMNADALYSMAWVDMRNGPLLFTVPEMKKHAYVFQLLDAWSDVFANPGTNVIGSEAASFALVPPCWQGALPAGAQKIECPTDLVWIIGRIGLDNDADMPEVQKLQTGFGLTPLSGPEPAQDKRTAVSNRPPVELTDTMGLEAYFDMAMDLLQTTRVHSNDWPLITELTALGIVPGGTVSALDPAVLADLKRGADRAIELLKNGLEHVQAQTINGWYMDTRIGTYGTDYFTRALIAREGLGALTPQDAVYALTHLDSDRRPLDGKNNYILHFKRDELPPVRAYWSLTLYTQDGFFSENQLHRNALRSRDQLSYNRDGSLDIYIQHKEPKANKISNWLPAPAGRFNLVTRLALPGEEILYGAWHMPGVRKQIKKWMSW